MHLVEGVRDEFYTLLVDAIAQHGSEAIKSLREAFEREWNRIEASVYWSIDVRRQIILALWRVGVCRDWVVEKLQALEENMLDGRDINGRIDECHEQAKAWICLGEKESERRLLQWLFQVSLGVSYRKDYQLDTWIEWLGRINSVEPQRAAGRIGWFAQVSAMLEESTEGKASRSAAKELLSVTFQWSPRRAISLFRWLYDQKRIWYEEAVSLLLKEALKSSQDPTELVLYAFADFLLPIDTRGDSALVSLLIERTAINSGNEKVLEVARYLLTRVNTYALPSLRAKWCCTIMQALQNLKIELPGVAFVPMYAPPEPEGESSSNLLKLIDGSSLSIGELIARTSSISELHNLLNNEANNSYFDWEPVIKNIIEDLRAEDIYHIASLFQGKRNSARILAVLSKRLYAIGDAKGAWSLGEQALTNSTSRGWGYWWGRDGSRLAALESLACIDADKTRPLTYKTLFQDLTGELPDTKGVALNLDKILPLLTKDLPLPAIWSEIEQYVHTLFEGCSLPDNEPLGLEVQPSHDTTARAIADLILLHLAHPVVVVAQAAERACGKLLLLHNPIVQQAVHEFFDRNEDCQEAVLRVLDAVSFKEPQAVAPFCQKILSLYKSRNYAIRQASYTICKRLDLESELVQPCPISLPVIYQFSLTPVDIEILRPLNRHIECIAEEAGLPLENVCHRAVQIMRQLAPEESWSAQGESQLQKTLYVTGLRLTYNKPRAILARRAMFYIMAELADSGVINTQSIRNLEPILQFYDPALVAAEPSARPSVISPIATGNRRWLDKEWLTKINEVLHQDKWETPDGLTILAEETTLKRLDEGKPTETRKSVVDLASTFDPVLDDEHNSFFESVTNRYMADYPDLRVNATLVPTVLRHRPFYYNSSAEHWLALNPTVGYDLSWMPSTGGFFRWVDNRGQIMVESVWWTDGLLDQNVHIPHPEDEVGEGWLVLATPKAFEQLREHYHPLKRLTMVRREYYDDEQGLMQESALKQSLLEP